MSAHIDERAICEARSIGAGSSVGAFARIGPEVEIGAGCIVGDQAVIDGRITLGDDVEVGAGGRLLGSISVGPGAIVGVNAVVVAGDLPADSGEIQVGRGAVVRAGSVVTENVPANAIVAGNPARIVAYVDSGDGAEAREAVQPSSVGPGTTETRVPGVTLHRLTYARDLRGTLTAAEFSDLPFSPRRIFTVYHVPSESVRGSHAHRICAQLLVCMAGQLSCLVDDGSAREEVRLASPDVALHIPPMIWGTQWRYSRDAVLLVLASHPYDPADYIRDYEEFLELVGRGGAS